MIIKGLKTDGTFGQCIVFVEEYDAWQLQNRLKSTTFITRSLADEEFGF